MEQVGSLGLSRIAEQGLVFALLIANIVGLLWFIKYLLKELKDARVTAAADSKENTEVIKNNSIIMTQLVETVRHAVNK